MARKAKTLLPADLEKIADKVWRGWARRERTLLVCSSGNCATAGGAALRARFAAAVAEKGLGGTCTVGSTGCLGLCGQGPVVLMEPEGILYCRVKESDVARIVDEHLAGGKPVAGLMPRSAAGLPTPTMQEMRFFRAQERYALRNQGHIDPDEIDEAIATGAYSALASALGAGDRDAVVRAVEAAGLRGRGGAGFPTAKKWRAARNAADARGEDLYLICNAVDRTLIESDPHAVIEGMLLAAYALRAKEGFVFVRQDCPLALARVEKAIAAARGYGLLGDHVLGTEMAFSLSVRRAAGGFLSGEATAVVASMSGRVGEPAPKYVRQAEEGFRGRPTVVNNAETWANVPLIVSKGAAWFSAVGTPGSPGTKVLTISGPVRHAGVAEVPFGTTLAGVVDLAGGMLRGKTLKAFQTGGPSGGILPAALAGTRYDYEELAAAGTIVGNGNVAVMDRRTCMADTARALARTLCEESCGKCSSCREGLYVMHAVLGRLCEGKGQKGDLEQLDDLAAALAETSLCQYGKTAANPFRSVLSHFREELAAHLERRCPAGICKALVAYSINDRCNGCTVCALKCPVKAIAGNRKERHHIDPAVCIRCGICYDVCKFDAVEVK